jgi:MFS family permease
MSDSGAVNRPSGTGGIGLLLEPIRAMRLRYVPLLMVYFAYGALGLIDVARDVWVKQELLLTPAELAAIGVWLTLPWTIKVVFGELVDSVAILGSRRRVYILLGATCTASGMLALAAGAGEWFPALSDASLYIFGMLMIVIGTVIQDVVADAMSTEVVERVDADGKPRPDEDVRAELGMVQVLGRLALSIGILSVAGLSGYLAQILPHETVFLLGLAIPAISVLGVLLIRSEAGAPRPIDWRLLGGGIGFGAAVLALAFGGVPYSQEVIFVVSMTVVCGMLFMITRDVDLEARKAILFTSIVIFAFRAVPGVGDGHFWFTLDVLKFDEAFYGHLRQVAAVIGLVALWVLAKPITQYRVTTILLWLAVLGAILSIPNIALYYGIHEWTEEHFGFGARSIALLDTAAASPFAQLSMVPLLTLIAYHAPAGHRATWFALMASLMNLALVAGQLQTKYLNQIFTVGRGVYDELGALLITAAMLGLLIPVAAIALFGRRI